MKLSGKMFILINILLVICLIIPIIQIGAASNSKTFKILHVMSYHSPWEWTDSMFQGFQDALKGVNVEYKVYQMDTKRNSSEEWKDKAGKEARALVDSWKPDLLYVTDDDAPKYVAKYYVNTALPIVYAAVNSDPAVYNFTGSSNVTGVMEIEHFVESVKLLQQIVPAVKKIAVVIDEAAMWGPVVERMKTKQKQVPGVQFIKWDKVLTYAEYKQKIAEYQTTVDAIALLGIFNYKDQKGQNVPYQEVQQWTAENSKLPDFSYWKDRVSYGTLCVVSVSGYQQGLAAGKMAKEILVNGKSPAKIPVTQTNKGEPIVSLARANKLGIKIKSKVLLTAQVMNQFEWEKK
ncbi:MAG TPA: ABC transporter substrate binding protein [Bacillota bacterium]|nr:ABC transporter substrate binding protein [Bacillota bacterium]